MGTDKHGFGDANFTNFRAVLWSGFNSRQFVKFVSALFLSVFIRVHPWLNNF